MARGTASGKVNVSMANPSKKSTGDLLKVIESLESVLIVGTMSDGSIYLYVDAEPEDLEAIDAALEGELNHDASRSN